jgi:hypothetical protein
LQSLWVEKSNKKHLKKKERCAQRQGVDTRVKGREVEVGKRGNSSGTF